VPISWLVAAFAIASIGILSSPASAAEITDVVDALDDINDDPFDFHIEPTFRQTIQRGTIVREAPCTPDPDGPASAFQNADNCPDEATTIFTRELDYERVINALDIDLQIGIWRDLEFHLTLPIIISDTRTLSFAEDDSGRVVSQDNSAMDPADEFIQDDVRDGGLFETYRYLTVGAENVGPDRAGVGDLTFGLAWSPFNTERQPHLATLTLGFDYTAPTATVADRTNTAVGRGVHELRFSVNASKRYSIVEPYFGLEYLLPITGSDSLFEDYGGGQTRTGPGMGGEVLGGAEFIVYENAQIDQLFTIDLGFVFGFQAEGRDYSVLSDALGGTGCNGLTPNEADFVLDGSPYEPSITTSAESAGCAWILQQPSSRQTSPGTADEDLRYVHDGITSIESYATIGARVAMNFQISEYVEIRLNTEIETETEHFLTSARTGRDRDGDDEVDFNDPNERNPVYNPTIDGVGHRLRAQSVLNIDWGAAIAFQF